MVSGRTRAAKGRRVEITLLFIYLHALVERHTEL